MPPDLAAKYEELLAHRLPRALAALRSLPLPVAVLLLALGLAVLLAGARSRRPIAALGGLLAGAVAGLALSGVAAQARISATTAVGAGAAGVALLSAAFPPLFPLVLGAVLGGGVGVRLPLGHPAVGAAAGAVVVGAAAVVGARPLAAGLAGLAGAALALAGAFALVPAQGCADVLARHPVLAVALTVVLGIAGAAAQLEAAWGGAPRTAPRKRALAQPRGRAEPGDA